MLGSGRQKWTQPPLDEPSEAKLHFTCVSAHHAPLSVQHNSTINKPERERFRQVIGRNTSLVQGGDSLSQIHDTSICAPLRRSSPMHVARENALLLSSVGSQPRERSDWRPYPSRTSRGRGAPSSFAARSARLLANDRAAKTRARTVADSGRYNHDPTRKASRRHSSAHPPDQAEPAETDPICAPTACRSARAGSLAMAEIPARARIIVRTSAHAAKDRGAAPRLTLLAPSSRGSRVTPRCLEKTQELVQEEHAAMRETHSPGSECSLRH